MWQVGSLYPGRSISVSTGWVPILLALAVGLSCSDDDAFQRGQPAELSVPEQITFPGITLGETSVRRFELENTGSGALEIRGVKLADNPEEFNRGDEWISDATIPPGEARTLAVRYQPVRAASTTSAIVIRSNAQNAKNGETTIELESLRLNAALSIKDPIRFGVVEPGETEHRVVTARNAGHGPLELDDVLLSGSDNFQLTYPNPKADAESGPSSDLDQLPQSTIAPGNSLDIRLWFEPDSPTAERGQLMFFTSSKQTREYSADLIGNGRSACVSVSFGDRVDFGTAAAGNEKQMTGYLKNCSTDNDLKLKSLEVTDGANGTFDLNRSPLPDGLAEETVEISPQDQIPLELTFSPKEVRRYEGRLKVESNDPVQSSLSVKLLGRGIKQTPCPGNRQPTPEVCGDDKDNDCDGTVDEGCNVEPPTVCIGGEADRTPWEIHRGGGPECWPTKFDKHGAKGEYKHASIPAEDDSGWSPEPDNEISFDERSAMCGDEDGGSRCQCLKGGDFTYFQTFFQNPPDFDVDSFKVSIDNVDDGARITIFNSDHPDGVVDPGSYAFLRGDSTTNLAKYLVEGRNRIVITHVDDCCRTRRIEGVNVIINGDEVQDCNQQ